jgi:L-threonylcarbamoyladenylate synthase
VRTDVLLTSTSKLRAATTEIAASRLREGDIVALPTETVYGLAADGLNPIAVAKIFEAKERPRFDPLIIHLPNRDWLDRVTEVPGGDRQLVQELVDRFWPGPCTIVVPRKSIVPEIVTAGLDRVAVRVSAHPVFSDIICAFGRPLAAPSANRFGRISPTTAQHVIDELDGRIPLIVDAGPTRHGIESTIIAVRNGRIELLRRGPITDEQLDEFGHVVLAEPVERPDSPGQLPSHYAPSTSLVLADDLSSFTLPLNKRCGLLAWRPRAEAAEFVEVRQLSSRQDLREAAANLFRYLRELDQLNLDLIVAERVPGEGLGAAIMDRLVRAAGGGN